MPVSNFGLAQKRSTQDGVKKEYIFKNFLSKLGGIMNGTLNMNLNRIKIFKTLWRITML